MSLFHLIAYSLLKVDFWRLLTAFQRFKLACNLMIVVGPLGFTGSPGSLGPQGFAGGPGATGWTGPSGSPGPPGIIGGPGGPGFTGSTGATGYTGFPGPCAARCSTVFTVTKKLLANSNSPFYVTFGRFY